MIYAQSLYYHNEYYVFRPLGNDNYKEIKFRIEKGEIIEDRFNKLIITERVYIHNYIL